MAPCFFSLVLRRKHANSDEWGRENKEKQTVVSLSGFSIGFQPGELQHLIRALSGVLPFAARGIHVPLIVDGTLGDSEGAVERRMRLFVFDPDVSSERVVAGDRRESCEGEGLTVPKPPLYARLRTAKSSCVTRFAGP